MLQKAKLFGWLAIVVVFVITVAWQTKAHSPHARSFPQDTVPNKERSKEDETIINGDLDRALDEVKKAQEHLDYQFQKGGFEKMQKELLRAQAQLNSKDIHSEIAKAMKEIELQKFNLEEQFKAIDMQKIQAETQDALQKINWDKVEKDMQQAQAELKNNFDSKKLEAGVRESMEQTKKAMAQLKAMDMQNVQQQLEHAQEALRANEGKMQEELERARKNINDQLHKDFSKELQKAKEGVQKAAEELEGYKQMVAEMRKDGLLKQDGSYNIKYKNGELLIDGMKQPGTITEKYKHYFKQEDVRLKKTVEGTEDKKTIDL